MTSTWRASGRMMGEFLGAGRLKAVSRSVPSRWHRLTHRRTAPEAGAATADAAALGATVSTGVELPAGPLPDQVAWLVDQVQTLRADADRDRRYSREADAALRTRLHATDKQLVRALDKVAVGELRMAAVGLLLVTLGAVAAAVPGLCGAASDHPQQDHQRRAARPVVVASRLDPGHDRPRGTSVQRLSARPQ
ncbi:hypothetical protein AB0M29_36310 [Streptomyces sp. NPDC051976]|uniref:hypothetical protein n=1 Tax=Streptomyces sp. NPDC051976 TaxID=3154947 RepID=UPI00342A9F3A